MKNKIYFFKLYLHCFLFLTLNFYSSLSHAKLPEIEFNESRSIPVQIRYNATPEAEALFYQMPDWVLPPVPIGYKWQRNENNGLLLLRHHSAKNHDIEIVIYGPDKNKINYSAFIDGRNYQSLTHTRPANDPFMDHGCPKRRRYPITPKDFEVYDYYILGGQIYKEQFPLMKCIRGHGHDKYDTMQIGRNLPMGIGPAKMRPILEHEKRFIEGRYYSTFDKKNYVPEPGDGYWGENLRNHYVDSIRARNGCYIQYPYYDSLPRLTENGTAVPAGVTFVGIKGPSEIEVFDVPWEFSYPTGKSEVDQQFLFNNFRDHYIPTPLVCRNNRPPQEIVNDVDALVAQANSHFSRRTYEKKLNRLSQAGELEFFSPSNKIELALGYSEYIVKPYEAKFWLGRAEEQALFLDQQIGDKRIILSAREYEDIVLSFSEESPGFEDPFDNKVDLWGQLYRNQQD